MESVQRYMGNQHGDNGVNGERRTCLAEFCNLTAVPAGLAFSPEGFRKQMLG
jgi:hypothetical protein